MVDLVGQHLKIKSEIDSAIGEVINSGQFIKGPIVSSFENKLANYLNVKHVISCANGTDALQVALMAMDLEKGDEVILPAFTYPATIEVVALLNLTPVLVDVNLDSFNICIESLQQSISPKTKVIIPVHLFGQGADMNSILTIANEYGIKIIEDNAQALGASMMVDGYGNRKSGTIGDIGITSFFPTKNLGCLGDGGAIFTNDDKIAQKLRMICNHGQIKKYYHEIIGVNSRLDALQAAVLNIKLDYLDAYIETKKSTAKRYNEAFDSIDEIEIPYQVAYSDHTYHQYTIQVKDRDTLKEYLNKRGIPSIIYYPLSLHKQEAYKNLVKVLGSLSNSELLSQSVLSIPIHTELSQKEQNYIIDSIKTNHN